MPPDQVNAVNGSNGHSSGHDLQGGASKCPLSSSTNGSPSVPSPKRQNSFYADGWAARVHDDVNLGVLAVMSLVAAWSMYQGDTWTQYALTQFAAGYMVLDGCWIFCNRAGVKSPRTVMGHHMATLSVLIDPLLQRQHAFYTACALLVEFNTFLLILRRRVTWGRYLEIPFALSWVALRLIWYPFLGFYMAMCAFPETLSHYYPTGLIEWRLAVEDHRPVPMFVGSFIAWVGICLFQGWWSCALVRSYSRPSKSKKFL